MQENINPTSTSENEKQFSQKTTRVYFPLHLIGLKNKEKEKLQLETSTKKNNLNIILRFKG